MDWSLLLKGLVTGFAIAAPVGPIGLLCIQRTLVEGRLTGLATGLGAASADAVYGLIAALGLSAIATFLQQQQMGLAIVGGIFLCYLGVRTLLSQPATIAAQAEGNGRLVAYASTFLLTLTNPMTIFAFIGVFAGLGLATAPGQYQNAVATVAGVFLGSAAWWLLLTGVVGLARRHIGPHVLQWVNRLAGVLITGFGVYLLAGLL